ncbi:MAG: four helix bundle protein [Bacteroidota bacterium]|nr:four helix bundle protein [Bacteroidota bacterium]
MNQIELKKRTKQFAIDIVRYVKSMPDGRDAWKTGDQLYRAGTSVGANYRAACRSKTKPTFVHKLGIVEEEADECCFWLEIIIEVKMADIENAEKLLKEANELTAIFTAANKTLNDRSTKN